MTVDTVQPSLNRHLRMFGGGRLSAPSHDRRSVILQSPPMAIGPEYAQGWDVSLAAGGALADSAREWVRIVLKSKRNRASAKKSIMDLPPLDLGEVLYPVSGDEDLLNEMLDDTRF